MNIIGGAVNGGAINAMESKLTLTEVIFNNNLPSSSSSKGAAIYSSCSNNIINQWEFNGNKGGDGGALYSTSDTLFNIINQNSIIIMPTMVGHL